jgi:hypothetical protein
LLDTQHCGGHRTQAAGVAHGDHHGRIRGTGHGALDDRQLDAEQVKNASVRPLAHGSGSPNDETGQGRQSRFFNSKTGLRASANFPRTDSHAPSASMKTAATAAK